MVASNKNWLKGCENRVGERRRSRRYKNSSIDVIKEETTLGATGASYLLQCGDKSAPRSAVHSGPEN
jgi:hypothetical protein